MNTFITTQNNRQ